MGGWVEQLVWLWGVLGLFSVALDVGNKKEPVCIEA